MSPTSDPIAVPPIGLRAPSYVYGIIGLLVAVLSLGTGASSG
jgi:hypothetical protein